MPTIESVQQPSIHAAKDIIEKAIVKKALLTLLARCRVEYEGRGASRLGEGDRLIIIKPDGAVLVHRPTGYSPVNWQPDSKLLEVREDNGELVITSIRSRPREILTIRLVEVYSITVAYGMQDKAEFIEYLDEHEIRDFLARHPDYIEPGLRIVRIEKPVEPGFIDLYAIDSKGRHVVIEIKRVTAGREAVLQLKRYVDALAKAKGYKSIRGILVAPSITRQALELLNTYKLEYRFINIEKIYRELKREKQSKTLRSLLDFIS